MFSQCSMPPQSTIHKPADRPSVQPVVHAAETHCKYTDSLQQESSAIHFESVVKMIRVESQSLHQLLKQFLKPEFCEHIWGDSGSDERAGCPVGRWRVGGLIPTQTECLCHCVLGQDPSPTLCLWRWCMNVLWWSEMMWIGSHVSVSRPLGSCGYLTCLPPLVCDCGVNEQWITCKALWASMENKGRCKSNPLLLFVEKCNSWKCFFSHNANPNYNPSAKKASVHNIKLLITLFN